jgi:hypothetical protein
MAEVKKVDVYSLLRKKYPSNEYCLMEEVSDAAGFSRSRSADYIAVNLWPSRGLSIIGIELKSFRSDWLSELKKPAKAENIFKYCDYFYLLTTDETIAKMDEIPASWGWLCIKGNCIKVMKDAPKQEPVPTTRHFITCMLKRAADKTNFIHRDSIQERIDAAKEEGKNIRGSENRFKIDEYDNLKKSVIEFETASGVSIKGRWDQTPVKIGAAVNFITNGGVDSIKKDLSRLQITAENILKEITKAMAVFNETTAP